MSFVRSGFVLLAVAILVSFFIISGACFADDKAPASEEKPQTASDKPLNADEDWSLTVGGARTWPSLASANRDIRDIQGQLRAGGANVGTLPTWENTFTGNIGAGIQRRLPVLDGRLWLGYFFSYGQGPISHSQGITPSPAGFSPGSHFEQVYRFQGNELFMLLDVLTFKHVVVNVGGSFGLNTFSSDTDVAVYGPGLAMTSLSRSKFSDVKPSVGIQAGMDYLFTKNIALDLTARYGGCVFSGSTPVTTTTVVPGAAFQQIQPKYTTVDVSGPSIGMYLKFYF